MLCFDRGNGDASEQCHKAVMALERITVTQDLRTRWERDVTKSAPVLKKKKEKERAAQRDESGRKPKKKLHERRIMYENNQRWSDLGFKSSPNIVADVQKKLNNVCINISTIC